MLDSKEELYGGKKMNSPFNESFFPIITKKNIYMSKADFIEFIKNLKFEYVAEYNLKFINNFIYDARENTITEQGYTINKSINGDDINAMDK